jgi:hypothetical protein
MKMKALLILVFLPILTFSQNTTDTTKHPIRVSGSIQVTNNGISPVPAFSLGKPAIMTSFTISKKNLSFTPQFNYGIDGRPWSSNNWLRLQIPHKKLTFRVGINWSLFFKQQKITENGNTFNIKRVNRYLENELAVFYQLNDKTTIQAIWWHDEGMDIDAVKRGSFYSLSSTISKIPLSKNLKLTLVPHIFYLNNKIPFKGFFVSGIAIFSYKNSPFTISVQDVQPIWVESDGKSSWNIGLNWSF